MDGGRHSWNRSGVFGDRWTDRRILDFVEPSPMVQWLVDNPYQGVAHGELETAMAAQSKWRYHHGIGLLADGGHLYRSYSDRVGVMLDMIRDEIGHLGLDVESTSFLDIGTAEGYTASMLADLGATDVDAVDINENVLDRLWLVRAYTGRSFGRVGVVDVERVDWSMALGRTYDVSLALGVIYHMENPVLFARNLFEVTRSVAIVESDTPRFPSNERFRGFGNVYLHRDQVTLGPDNIRYLLELRPDRQALVEILLNAGFARIDLLTPTTPGRSTDLDSGAKTVVVAFKDESDLTDRRPADDLN